jgi:hypothetical protein
MQELSKSEPELLVKLEASFDTDVKTSPSPPPPPPPPPSASTNSPSSLNPASSSSASSILLNSFSPSKFSQLNGNNKITIVPLGSTSGNVLPIKRVVQVNAGGGGSSSSNAPVASLLSSSPNRSLTASSLSNVTIIEKSPNKIITSINSNANGGNTSSNNSALSNSGNKIQYVKIVNMSSMNSSNNNSTNSNVTLSASSANTNVSGVITNSTGFKITTINANNGSGASSQVKIS